MAGGPVAAAGGINPRDVLRSAQSTADPRAKQAYQELLKQSREPYRVGSNQAWMDDSVPVTSSGFMLTSGTTVNYCASPAGALTFTGDQLMTK